MQEPADLEEFAIESFPLKFIKRLFKILKRIKCIVI